MAVPDMRRGWIRLGLMLGDGVDVVGAAMVVVHVRRTVRWGTLARALWGSRGGEGKRDFGAGHPRFDTV